MGVPEALFHFGVKRTNAVSAELKLEPSESAVGYKFILQPRVGISQVFFQMERIAYPTVARPTLTFLKESCQSESMLIQNSNLEKVAGLNPVLALMALNCPYHFHDTTNTAAVRRAAGPEWARFP